MWIFAPDGSFYSVVQKPQDRAKNMLTVRSRNRADIDALVESYFPHAKPYRIEYSDYEWRIRVSKKAWARAMSKMAHAITYDNYKDEVTRCQGRKRHDVYSRVWSALLALEDRGRRFSFKGKGKQQALDFDERCPNCASRQYVRGICGDCGYDQDEEWRLFQPEATR
jgi:hypothetical protein